MKSALLVLSLVFSINAFASTQNMSCKLAGGALDALDFVVDSENKTLEVIYAFQSGETQTFVTEETPELFDGATLVATKLSAVAMNDNSFSYGGAFFQSALIAMDDVMENGYRNVQVAAGGNIYTGTCK